MKKQPKIDKDLKRWCDVLAQSSIQIDEVPQGWFTTAQIADMIGKSVCTTSERIRKMVKEGSAERKDFRIQLEQRVRPVPHYRLK